MQGTCITPECAREVSECTEDPLDGRAECPESGCCVVSI